MYWTKLRLIISSRAFIAIVGLILVGGALVGFRAYRNRPRFVFVPNDVSVTIPEGTNIADIDQIISKAGVFAPGTLLREEVLKYEGKLFPNTYRFDKGSNADDVISRMQREYTDWDQLILASILEKEVQTEEDMRIAAGILLKRLDAGMPLQVDASVAYGACLSIWKTGRYCDVTEVNLVDNIKKDSAYNTYTRRGLPVGPISNPGSRALSAAANPQASPYWYYLSAKDGTIIYSRTLEEHNRARARYLW